MTRYQSSPPLHQLTQSNRKQYSPMAMNGISSTSSNSRKSNHQHAHLPVQSPAFEFSSTKATPVVSSSTSSLFKSPMANDAVPRSGSNNNAMASSTKTLFKDDKHNIPPYYTTTTPETTTKKRNQLSSTSKQRSNNSTTTTPTSTTRRNSKKYSTSTNETKPILQKMTVQIIQQELSKQYKTTLFKMADSIAQNDDIINLHITLYLKQQQQQQQQQQRQRPKMFKNDQEKIVTLKKRKEIENAMSELQSKVNSFGIYIENWDQALKYLNEVFIMGEEEDDDDDDDNNNDDDQNEDETTTKSSSQESHPLLEYNLQSQKKIPLGKDRGRTKNKRKIPIKKSSSSSTSPIKKKSKAPPTDGVSAFLQKIMDAQFGKVISWKPQFPSVKMIDNWKSRRVSKLSIVSKMRRGSNVSVNGQSVSSKNDVSFSKSELPSASKIQFKSSSSDDIDLQVGHLTDYVENLCHLRVDDATRVARMKETKEQKLIEKRIKEEEEEERKRLEEEEKRRQEALEAASKLLRPLTDDEMEIVNNAINGHGADNEVIAESDTDSVQRKSMKTLQPGCWLNDEVIHYFYLMLTRRDELNCKGHNEKRRSHFFKSFFLTKLFDEGGTDQYRYANVKRWSKKVPGKDIFQLDKIFFPCNVRNTHWCCAVIFMQEKRIQFYDSMMGSGMYYLEGLMRYLKDEWSAKKGGDLPDADQWQLVTCEEDTPQQSNGFDCGVFTCMFADFLSLDRPLSFNQEHITQCRERIALSIMKGVAIE